MNPLRLKFIVEGKTEEAFVNQILKPYFLKKEIYISAQKITTSWHGGQKFSGGGIKYDRIKTLFP